MTYYIAFDKENSIFYVTDELPTAVTVIDGNILSYDDEDTALDMAESFTASLGFTGPCGITVHYCEKHNKYHVVRTGSSLQCKCTTRKD